MSRPGAKRRFSSQCPIIYEYIHTRCKLEEKCDQFAVKNLKEIFESDEFLQLEPSYITLIMKSKDTETTVPVKVHALLTWTKLKSVERRPISLDCFNTMDLAVIPMEYRKYLLEHEPLISDDAKCLKLLMLPLFSKVEAKGIKHFLDTDNPRKIVVFDRTSGFLQSYDPAVRNWEKMQKLHADMKSTTFSAVRHRNRVYVLMADRSLYQLENVNTAAEWDKLPSMAENHGSHPPLAVFRECLFVVGVCDLVYSNSVEKFDPSTRRWAKSVDKNVICRLSTAIGLGEHLYSIGGMEDWNLKQVEQLDSEETKWTFMAPMIHARNSPGLVGFHGKIYAFGGFDNATLSVAEVFDPVTNSWTAIAPMKNCRWGFNALMVEGSIYVVGSSAGGGNRIEEYDPVEDKWEVIAELNTMKIEPYASIAI